MKYRYLLVFLFTCSIVFGQNLKDLYDIADKNYAAGNYSEAINYYNNILDYENNIPAIQLKIANAHRLNMQYSIAEIKYKGFIKQYRLEFASAFFWLAETQSILGNQLDANTNYRLYLELSKKNTPNYKRAQHEYRKTVCSSRYDTLISIIKDTISPFIQSYGIYSHNSKILYNGIMLMSDSTTGTPSFYSRATNDSALLSILTKDDYAITDYIPSTIKDSLNFVIRSLNDSSFTPTIYYTKKIGANWTEPKENELLEYSNTIVHPSKTVYESKDILYFSSYSEDGYGGMDIWFATLEKGIIVRIQNAGPNINTAGDEICPFYYKNDSCLYFSSNWKNSMGGFDIFKAEGGFMNWEEAYNIGRPINTSFNELYYKIHDSTAYFTSNKEITQILDEPYYLNKVYTYSLPKKEQVLEDTFNTKINKQIAIKDSLTFSLYFDHNRPIATDNITSFSTLYNEYILNKKEYLKNNTLGLDGISKYVEEKKTNTFFNDLVTSQYQDFTIIIDSLNTLDSQKITFELEAYTSTSGSYEYNSSLANRRFSAIEMSLYNLLESNDIDVTRKEKVIPSNQGDEDRFDIDAAQKRKVVVTIYIY